MLTSNLACGPMSEEVIEAVFRYSDKFGIQLMLICSRNQIDVNSGYVFTTKLYMDYVGQMKRKYPRSDVVICRDHCGPGFGPPDTPDRPGLESTRQTIYYDIANGFDLIHLDLCRAAKMGEHNGSGPTPMTHDEKIDHTIELMQYALGLNHETLFEIGTDENNGIAEADILKIHRDVEAINEIAKPEFYVVKTGSLVYEDCNIGRFDSQAVAKMSRLLHANGLKLKEHNADYLNTTQIKQRNGLVDAVNIAPQLGIIQTNHVLSKALVYGIDTKPFVAEVVDGQRWTKWTDYSDRERLCALIAGHYHFRGPAYQELINALSKETCIRESIITEIYQIIEHYLFAME